MIPDHARAGGVTRMKHRHLRRRRVETGRTSGPAPAEQARAAMVEHLRTAGFTDSRVLEAMGTVPRERFVPPRTAAEAYGDHPVPIGAGQTISAPDIVAMTAAALELTGTESVLEVGGGSGYAAAVLGRLADRVVTLERRGHLAERARSVLADLGYNNIEVRHADGMAGAADAAPFDAIAVAAMADEVPPPLFEQLTPDGVLVCPVGERSSGALLRFRGGGRELLSRVSFVPLREGLDR